MFKKILLPLTLLIGGCHGTDPVGEKLPVYTLSLKSKNKHATLFLTKDDKDKAQTVELSETSHITLHGIYDEHSNTLIVQNILSYQGKDTFSHPGHPEDPKVTRPYAQSLLLEKHITPPLSNTYNLSFKDNQGTIIEQATLNLTTNPKRKIF